MFNALEKRFAQFLISFNTVEQKRCTTDSSILILPTRTIVLQIISDKGSYQGRTRSKFTPKIMLGWCRFAWFSTVYLCKTSGVPEIVCDCFLQYPVQPIIDQSLSHSHTHTYTHTITYIQIFCVYTQLQTQFLTVQFSCILGLNA